MNDNTFVYPLPILIEPPRPDPSTVMDFIISPKGDELLDRGGMRKVLPLGGAAAVERPAILQDGPGKPFFLRFDGKDDYLRPDTAGMVGHPGGVLNLPPGPYTLEMWFRPAKLGNPQTLVNDKLGQVMNVGITPEGVLRFARGHQRSMAEAILLEGEGKLEAGKWHHIVAVFSGSEMSLYLNGKRDGKPVACHGLKTDNGITIGMGKIGGECLKWKMPKESDNPNVAVWDGEKMEFLNGDIARIRVLQIALDDDEISNEYKAAVGSFETVESDPKSPTVEPDLQSPTVEPDPKSSKQD
jgi:hypothetical protein